MLLYLSATNPVLEGLVFGVGDFEVVPAEGRSKVKEAHEVGNGFHNVPALAVVRALEDNDHLCQKNRRDTKAHELGLGLSASLDPIELLSEADELCPLLLKLAHEVSD